MSTTVHGCPAPVQDSPVRHAVPRRRHGSWRPAETYTATCILIDADLWLTLAREAITSPQGDEARRRHTRTGTLKSVAQATVLRAAECEAQAADRATGRGIATSHETLAAMMGVTRDTAREARRVLVQLGLEATIEVGRHMTNTERAAAHAAHGGHQIAYASTRYLTVPRQVRTRRPGLARHATAGFRVNPPKSLPLGEAFGFKSGRPHLAREAREAGKKTKPRKTRKQHAAPSLAAQRLAAQLANAWPALASRTRRDHRALGHVHLWAIARILDRLGYADPAAGWTGPSLKTLLDRRLADHGWTSLPADAVHSVAGLLHVQLHDARALVTETPAQRRDREQAEAAARDAERARALAEAAAARAVGAAACTSGAAAARAAARPAAARAAATRADHRLPTYALPRLTA